MARPTNGRQQDHPPLDVGSQRTPRAGGWPCRRWPQRRRWRGPTGTRAASGWSNGGRFGTARENSPDAGRGAEPDEHERTDAGGQQPREQDQRGHGAAEADRLHEQERAQQRVAEQRRHRGEAPRRPDHRQRLAPARRVLRQLHEQRGDAAAEGDERRFGTDDGAQTERRQRRQQDAGQLDALRRGAGLEPVGRRVAAAAGQVADRGADDEAGHHQREHRPPGRLAVEAQAVGQVGEHPLLEVVDQREEVVRADGDRHPDHRGEDQEHDVAAGAQHRERIGGHVGRHLISHGQTAPPAAARRPG